MAEFCSRFTRTIPIERSGRRRSLSAQARRTSLPPEKQVQMNPPMTHSCGALDKRLHLESHLRCWAAKGLFPRTVCALPLGPGKDFAWR